MDKHFLFRLSIVRPSPRPCTPHRADTIHTVFCIMDKLDFLQCHCYLELYLCGGISRALHLTLRELFWTVLQACWGTCQRTSTDGRGEWCCFTAIWRIIFCWQWECVTLTRKHVGKLDKARQNSCHLTQRLPLRPQQQKVNCVTLLILCLSQESWKSVHNLRVMFGVCSVWPENKS